MKEHVYSIQLSSTEPDNNDNVMVNMYYSNSLQGAIDVLIPEANISEEFKKAKIIYIGRAETFVQIKMHKNKMPYLLLLSKGIIGAIKDYADFHELPVDELTGTSLN